MGFPFRTVANVTGRFVFTNGQANVQDEGLSSLIDKETMFLLVNKMKVRLH